MTTPAAVLRFIRDNDKAEVGIDWNAVILHFHPEADDGKGNCVNPPPRQTLQPLYPQHPDGPQQVVEETQLSWPVEDTLNDLLDAGYIYEPTLGVLRYDPMDPKATKALLEDSNEATT